jgi:hypothetical protein
VEVWRAFELRPEPVPTLDPKGAYLENVWRDSVYPLAKKLGRRRRIGGARLGDTESDENEK